MLVMNNTNVNFDAVSQNEEGTTLATMGASYSGRKRIFQFNS